MCKFTRNANDYFSWGRFSRIFFTLMMQVRLEKTTGVSRHHGTQFRAPWNLSSITKYYRTKGLQVGPQLSTHYAERRQALAQPMHFFPVMQSSLNRWNFAAKTKHAQTLHRNLLLLHREKFFVELRRTFAGILSRIEHHHWQNSFRFGKVNQCTTMAGSVRTRAKFYTHREIFSKFY